MKLIGYARVDPMEGDKAVKEVKYAREILGLRGLKLHPRSEGWIDNVNENRVINVLVEAAKHSLPVIFDTRGRGTILSIAELIRSTRAFLSQNHPSLVPHFKVIIAHFAQGNIGDTEVYNAVVQPNVYGDLSMLHGEGAGNFFEDFRLWFKSNNKIVVDNRDWSEYLLYASDYPYFGDVHAEKLMIYIINKRFFDSGGTLADTRNILGLNQLKILPEYNLYPEQKSKKSFSTTIISQTKPKISPYDLGIKGLAKLINENKMDIKKFCVQFKTNWNDFNNILIDAVKPNTKEEILLTFMELVKDQISILAPLAQNSKWNSKQMKYFNPKDRTFFASLFNRTYLASDEEQITNCFNQILL